MLLFLLCLISNMCLIKSEDKQLLFGLDVDEKTCLNFGNYTYRAGDNVIVNLVNQLLNEQVCKITVIPDEKHTNNIFKNYNSSNFVTIPNVTEEYNGQWKIFTEPQDNKYKSFTCYINVKIESACRNEKLQTDLDANIHLPCLIAISILLIIVIAQSIGLLYLICKGRKTQQPKGLTTKEESPQSDIRYIPGPGIKSKKMIPIVTTDRQSEIYEVPDITSSDQDTLKSNISIRPPLPLPDEECVYSELPEISNPPASGFQPSVSPVVRPRPMRQGNIQGKQAMLFSEAQLEPPKPIITPAMLNRAIKPASQLSPVPQRKNDTPHTVGRKKEPLLPRSPPIKTPEPLLPRSPPIKTPDTLPKPMKHNEPKPPSQRSNEPKPPSQRNNDTLPNPVRSNAFQLPAVTRPIPGPSPLKKTLNHVGPVPPPLLTPPIPGPSSLKKPPKPLPPPTPTEGLPLEQQVQLFNDQRHQLPRESFDEREWDYEPLQQYNIYNI